MVGKGFAIPNVIAQCLVAAGQKSNTPQEMLCAALNSADLPEMRRSLPLTQRAPTDCRTGVQVTRCHAH